MLLGNYRLILHQNEFQDAMGYILSAKQSINDARFIQVINSDINIFKKKLNNILFEQNVKVHE